MVEALKALLAWHGADLMLGVEDTSLVHYI